MAVLQDAEQAVAVLGRDAVPHRGEVSDQRVERVDDGGGVLGADVRPDAGMAGGDAGHVAEAAGGQPEQRAVLFGPGAGRVHERRRDQVRDVRHHGDQAVVVCRPRGRGRPRPGS